MLANRGQIFAVIGEEDLARYFCHVCQSLYVGV